MPMASALTVARAFAHFLTLANIAEQHHRVHRRRDHARDPHGQPQRGSAAETLRATARGRGARRRAGRRHRLDAGRAGLHGASDRDRPPHAAAEAQSHRADSGVSRSPGPDAGRAGGVARRSSARDCGGLADRRSAPRARDPARRSARGARRVRAEPLGRASAVSARRRSRARRDDRHGASARRRADTFRIVDWRRSRRQSQHHAGSDAAGHVARALAGRRSVSQGHRRAAQRAVALGRRMRATSCARASATRTSRIACCSPKCAIASKRRAIWPKRRSRNLRRS